MPATSNITMPPPQDVRAYHVIPKVKNKKSQASKHVLQYNTTGNTLPMEATPWFHYSSSKL
jgi:hypothetical protein